MGQYAGNTIDFLLSPKRDLIAAKGFLQLALSAGQVRPRSSMSMVTRHMPSAIEELKESGDLG
jgi:IS6 family transposase